MTEKSLGTVEGRLLCNYCTKDLTDITPTALETHIQGHQKKGDEFIVDKNPEDMSFEEKKKFFERLYNDTEVKAKLSERAVLTDLKSIASGFSEYKEAYVPAINAKIKWSPLTTEDWLSLPSPKDNDGAYMTEFVYHSIKRWNTEYTKEKFSSEIPKFVVESMYIAINEALDFLVMSPLVQALERAPS